MAVVHAAIAQIVTRRTDRPRRRRRAIPAGQMNNPCEEEKLPTTAATTAPAITDRVSSERSRRYRDDARASITMNQPNSKPYSAQPHWAIESMTKATGQ